RAGGTEGAAPPPVAGPARPEAHVDGAPLARIELAATVAVLVEIGGVRTVDEDVGDRDGSVAGVLRRDLLLTTRVADGGRGEVQLPRRHGQLRGRGLRDGRKRGECDQRNGNDGGVEFPCARTRHTSPIEPRTGQLDPYFDLLNRH